MVGNVMLVTLDINKIIMSYNYTNAPILIIVLVQNGPITVAGAKKVLYIILKVQVSYIMNVLS